MYTYVHYLILYLEKEGAKECTRACNNRLFIWNNEYCNLHAFGSYNVRTSTRKEVYSAIIMYLEG